MSRFLVALPLPFLLLFLSCGSHRAAADPSQTQPGGGTARSSSSNGLDVPASRDADDFARFLAGLPGKSGSPYSRMEEDAAWRAHGKIFDDEWAKFQEKRVPVLASFQKKELHGAPNSGGTLFYPFGGPDFVTANLFFPNNNSYVFVGLEPAGTVRPVSAFENAPLASTLPRIRLTLDSLLRRSFFITDQMERQVRGQITDGLLPLLLVQMVRTGHTIRGHRYVTLDANGRYVERQLTDKGGRNKGVLVEFTRDGSDEVKRLAYFSVNLHNWAFKDNPEFQAFLGNLQPMSTFFKSASYLPHRDGFSMIRDQVLAKSNAIAQDDTGIPYRFFGQTWEVTLYGKYTKPYGSFAYMKQTDLRGAFEKGENVRDLGFFIGYGYGKAPSNLLVARRRSS